MGFVSILKDRIRERESGIGAPFPLNGELPPARFRLMLSECVQKDASLPNFLRVSHGLSAVVPFGLPDVGPDLRFECRILNVFLNISTSFRYGYEGLRSVADRFRSWLPSRAIGAASNLKLGSLVGEVGNALGGLATCIPEI